jgi:hypothetical protein
MYNVSNEYIEQISTGKISGKEIHGTITLLNGEVIELSNEIIFNSSLKINNSCDNGSDICIGSAYIGELKLDVFSDENRYLFNTAREGAIININYKLGSQIIPLGIYTVYSCVRVGKKLSISAYDNMCKLNKNIGSGTVNGTPEDLLNWISRKCDIVFNINNINDFVNHDVICNVSGENFSTYQSVLSEVCELMCCFAFANRSGEIELKKFQTEPCFELTEKMRKNTKTNDYDVYYTELVEKDTSNIKWVAVAGDGSGLTYRMNNVFIMGSEATKQTIVNNIMDELQNIHYTPASTGILYNPIFDLGDLITIKADGVLIKEDTNVLITTINYNYNGSSTLESVGSNRLLIDYSNDKTTSDSSTISQLKYNGTYISVFEGLQSYTINSTNKTITSIDYCIGSSDKVTLNGACQIDVTTAGTFEISYYLNGEKDIFETKQLLTAGNHTLNFSCWFDITEDLQNMYNTFEIKIKTSDGAGTIGQNKIKTYILASSSSDGLWKANNVFNENIPFLEYSDNSIALGWEEENEV